MVVVAVAMVELAGCGAGALLEEGQRRMRSLFWRLRAEMRRQVSKGRARKRQRFSFRYDPLSYALNFDDGCYGFFC